MSNYLSSWASGRASWIFWVQLCICSIMRVNVEKLDLTLGLTEAKGPAPLSIRWSSWGAMEGSRSKSTEAAQVWGLAGLLHIFILCKRKHLDISADFYICRLKYLSPIFILQHCSFFSRYLLYLVWSYNSGWLNLPAFFFFYNFATFLSLLLSYHPCWLKFPNSKFNPLRPTGPFMAHKLIILIKDWNSFFSYSKCSFNVSLCRTRCEFSMAIMLLKTWKLKKNFSKSRKILFCSQDGMG